MSNWKKDNRIAVIANNYGKSHDGIGAFSKVLTSAFSKEIAFDVYSAQCSENDSKLERCLTLGMTKSILKCLKHIKEYKAVLIEYPFVEWNPLILFAFKLLRYKSKKNGIKIVMSFHEYRRVNRLRKAVIRFMSKRCDLIFTSNKEMKNDLSSYNPNIIIRGIPTNIYGHATNKYQESLNKYVFFGLVNEAKAFSELIEGWDMFNQNEESTLFVVTATELSNIEKHKNIVYVHNAKDSDVFNIMNGCMFCILPVKPMIDEKNTTFKTGAIAGCICIGKFADIFSKEKFIIRMDNYTSEAFYNAFMESKKIKYEILKEMSVEARRFGKKYKPQEIAKIVEDNILKEIS